MWSTTPFFPGFPIAAWAAGKVFGSTMWGGLVVNHVASVIGAFFTTRTARALEIGPADSRAAIARETTLFWLAAPLTFFFFVFLSEALFACASALLIWGVVRGRWGVVLAAGIVAKATRNAGIVVCACALLLAWERREVVRVPRFGWAALAATSLGLVAFSVYQYASFGDALAWVKAQSAWGRQFVPPWETFRRDWVGFPGHSPGREAVDAMYRTQEVLALALLVPFFFLRRSLNIPRAVWLLGIAQWLLPLFSGSLMSAARYQSANLYFALAIPAFLAPRPLTRGVAWVLFGMVLAFYATMFTSGNWAS